jgi:hypothetical protein
VDILVRTQTHKHGRWAGSNSQEEIKGGPGHCVAQVHAAEALGDGLVPLLGKGLVGHTGGSVGVARHWDILCNEC